MSVKSLLLHLRLNWQFILMPIFVWGFYLSGGQVGPKFWLGLFVFHVLFYGGSVAFNSYYDRDEGPIGGLWKPPKVTRDLLYFSLAIQFLGLVLVLAFINVPLFVLSLVMLAMSTAYSHPAVRLKGKPLAGLLSVSIGQGAGGALAGWLSGQDAPASLLSSKLAMGLLVSALITTGFYPLTQIYQRSEDLQHGDTTFAVRWGTRCFPFAIACFGAAALAGAALLWRYYGPAEAMLIPIALVPLCVLVYEWWRNFDESQTRANYVRLMRIGYLMGFGFLLFVGWRLVRAL